MGRPPGARNREFESRRRELLVRLLPAVVAGGGQVSLHELARAADTSIPTLKHYFGDRAGAVAAALRTVREDAAVHIAALADPGGLDLELSLLKLGRELAAAWLPSGVGALFAAGLAAGLSDSQQAGPGYLDGVLEPTLHALEARLVTHARRGQLRLDPDDELALRTAAMAYLSPLLVALLHQHGLSGTRCRPLDIEAFIVLHTAHFVRAYGPDRPPAGRAEQAASRRARGPRR